MTTENRNRKPRMNVRKSNNNNHHNGYQNENRYRNQAHQMLEKYSNLAREALVLGDRVLAEGYYQHADHYQRILNELRASVVHIREQTVKEPQSTKVLVSEEKKEPPLKERSPKKSGSSTVIVNTETQVSE